MTDRTVNVEPEPFESVPHWLLFDPSLTAASLRVYLVLRKYRDYNTGECWPGRKKIAELADLSLKTVDRSLSNLETIGAITVTKRRKEDGSPASNLYDVHWDRGGRYKNDATLASETTLGVGTKTTHELRPISKQDPMNKKELAHFTEFWAAYPRKKGKGQAEKAWTKACKHTEPAVIVAAAVAFYQQCLRENVESRFVPYPATWLNGERWLDEPDVLPDAPQSNTQGWIALARQNAYNGSHEVVPELEAGAPWT